MTGGVGFSRQGKDSFNNNRKLLNRPPRMKDNPYAPTQKAKGDRDSAHVQELQDWWGKRKSKQKRWSLLIYGVLLPLVVVLAVLAAIFIG